MNTIRQIIKNTELTLSQTVYEDGEILDFPIPALGEWGVHEENPGKHSFKKMLLFQEALADKKTASDYYFLQEKIDSIDKQISEMLKEGPDAFKTEEFKELSKQKAAFRQRKANAEEQATAEAIQQFFPDHIPGENIFSVAYKGGVKAFSITELIADEGMPEKMRERPWFAGDMELLRSLWEKQSAEITQSGSGNPSGNAEEKRIGMEGGSCLIGSDEMLFVFRLTDGSVRTFDFNTMQELKKGQVLSAQTSTALWEFLESDSAQIESAKVECAKNAITSDEYEALDFLFYLAKKVNAKLVISIPDFSYEKTFMSLFGNLDQRFFSVFYEEFMSEVYRIADMNLQWINFFKKKYQVTDAVTLHGREPELTYVFAQKREAFLDAYVNRHLTGRNGMEEALKDYVCMPAMPYYLYGTKDVIEVNRLEEYPSIEKCKRAHRGAFRLHPMLFPQGVSANGKTASFYAAREFKEYVEWNRDSL